MSCLKLTSRILQPLGWFYNPVNQLSTTLTLNSASRRFKKRWINTDQWPKAKVNGETKTWMPNVPLTKVEDDLSREKAYFGMYDYLAVLGNDVTLTPKLFCKGPGYVRATNQRELFMLLKKRAMLGHHMHIEDMNAMQKRIKYLMKLENRVKKSRG
ncbi:large ribosomal subunit protein mL51-like [Ciona intestinalis]